MHLGKYCALMLVKNENIVTMYGFNYITIGIFQYLSGLRDEPLSRSTIEMILFIIMLFIYKLQLNR